MELSDRHYKTKKKYKYPAKSRRIWIIISVLLISCCVLDMFYYKKYRTVFWNRPTVICKRKVMLPGAIWRAVCRQSRNGWR